MISKIRCKGVTVEDRYCRGAKTLLTVDRWDSDDENLVQLGSELSRAAVVVHTGKTEHIFQESWDANISDNQETMASPWEVGLTGR